MNHETTTNNALGPPGGRRLSAGLGVALTAVIAALATLLLTPASSTARSAAAPGNTAPPTVAGTAATGRTLTASSGSWSGTTPISFSYEWLRCDANGASCGAIGGAVSSTYAVASGDVGHRLRVRVTATNGDGAATALSDATDVVVDADAPANTSEPAISGTEAKGSTLSATSGSWSGVTPISFSYSWVRCGTDGGNPDGSNCTAIAGASATTYTLGSADVGTRLRVRVTASNAAGTKTVASNVTGVIADGLAPRNTSEPSISGSPVQNQTLTASTGSWTGATPISYAFQWTRCGADGGKADASNCAVIGGATKSTLTLGSSDVGTRLRVKVAATNASGTVMVASNPTATVTQFAVGKPVNTAEPRISGTASVGSLLTATPGTWSGTTPITLAYQWLRCGGSGGRADGGDCPVVSGAGSASYRLTASDAGSRLRVRVTATNALGTTAAASNPTGTVSSSGPTGGTGVITLSNGERSISAASVPADQRLVVSAVVFSPNPVRSRTGPIVVRVKVKETRGYVVRDARVFIRSTPLVTTAADGVVTGTDGWVQVTLTPRFNFPAIRGGYSLQFYVKAYRAGDPVLGGVAGTRLVQVRLSR